MSAPLDLDQFGPTLANPDAAALLEECRRQRAEIERLRALLLEVAGRDRSGTPCYCDAFASGSVRHTEACKATARAALGEGQ